MMQSWRLETQVDSSYQFEHLKLTRLDFGLDLRIDTIFIKHFLSTTYRYHHNSVRCDMVTVSENQIIIIIPLVIFFIKN